MDPNTKPANRMICFGAFVFDPQSQKLTKHGLRVRLLGNPLRVFEALIEEPGRLVTREELRTRIWAADHFVDFGPGLNTAVKTLRQALGDDVHDPRFIETVPREGYRFIGSIEYRERQVRTMAAASAANSSPARSTMDPQQVAAAASPPEAPKPGPVTIQLPSAPAPAPPRLRSRKWMLGAGAAAAALITFAALYAGYPSRIQTETELLRVEPLVGLPNQPRNGSFSPDGRQVAFSWAGPAAGPPKIYIRDIPAGTTRQVTAGLGADTNPVWSSDGMWIVFIRDMRQTMLVRPGGGMDQEIAKAEFTNWAAFTPDSRSVVASSLRQGSATDYDLDEIAIEGGSRRRLTQKSDRVDGTQPFAYSPDGKYFAYVASFEKGPAALVVRPASGGPIKKITPTRGGWAWTPDSREIVFLWLRDGAWRLFRIDAERPETGPKPLYLPHEEGGYPFFALQARDADGPNAVRMGYEVWRKQSNVFHLELPRWKAGTPVPAIARPRPLALSSGAVWDLNTGPDGRVVFASGRSGTPELWVADPHTGASTRLTSFGKPYLHVASPRWSPDGKIIAFDSTSAVAGKNIFFFDVAAHTIRELKPGKHERIRPSWSRDGKWLYYSSNASGSHQIYRVSSSAAAADQAVQMTRNGGGESFESHDGKLLLFTKIPADGRWWEEHDLWALHLDGGGNPVREDVVLPGQVSLGFWALAPGGVFYADTRAYDRLNKFQPVNIPMAVHYWSLTSKTSAQIFEMEFGQRMWTPGLSVSSDGRHLSFVQFDIAQSEIKAAVNFPLGPR